MDHVMAINSMFDKKLSKASQKMTKVNLINTICES